MQTCKTEEWILVIANTGAKEPTDHKRLYCNYSQIQLIPHLIQELKGSLAENPAVDALIANRDALKNMLVTLYHRIQRPKQARILKSSWRTSQNILKHHIYCAAKTIQQKTEKTTYSFLTTTFRMLAVTPLDQNPALDATQSSIVVV